MDKDKIIFLLKNAIIETRNYADNNRDENQTSVLNTQKVFQRLKEEIEFNIDNVEEDVLRAMHDVGMSSYKEFENTRLEGIINNITEWLYLNISSYKNLKPLNADFKKWIEGGSG